MKRAYYTDSITGFLNSKPEEILGCLADNNDFALEASQKDAWKEEIEILKNALTRFEGKIYLEYSIPRMGKRIDAVIITGPLIYVLEFKIGEKSFPTHAIDQVMDYSLDLKNFHESSRNYWIAPILIATEAQSMAINIVATNRNDKLFNPINCNAEMLDKVIEEVIKKVKDASIDSNLWESGRYQPTPTIIEAALALYRGHSVLEISRSGADEINLSLTTDAIAKIIRDSKNNSWKSICFVTGVPGAGKTLVGLKIATEHLDKKNDLYSVFLSGNGPLVAILREALARDKYQSEIKSGHKIKKGEVRGAVKAFIQNVHNFRDECLRDANRPPIEHVALFDEAQRAWDQKQTSSFMLRKRGISHFDQSEPEFLISCLDRHKDWAVVVCLVGGGQEINTGEAGISEWIEALIRKFPDWRIFMSSRISDTEYSADSSLNKIRTRSNYSAADELHLGVSMRSFRAKNVSLLIKQLLDQRLKEASKTLAAIGQLFPIVITRDLLKAKEWLRAQARGTERYGIIASSEAQRLKPHAIDVKSPIDPVHWFLDGKDDVRSSYYLEDVATEFHVQGLELDWACVTWDADFRFAKEAWQHWSFCGDRWNQIKKSERKNYLKNSYRVLLTRARQGMVIVVPKGTEEDPTRKPEYYDPTFSYLEEIGFTVI